MASIEQLAQCEKYTTVLLKEFGQELWLAGLPVPMCVELERRLAEETRKYFDEIFNRHCKKIENNS